MPVLPMRVLAETRAPTAGRPVCLFAQEGCECVGAAPHRCGRCSRVFAASADRCWHAGMPRLQQPRRLLPHCMQVFAAPLRAVPEDWPLLPRVPGARAVGASPPTGTGGWVGSRGEIQRARPLPSRRTSLAFEGEEAKDQVLRRRKKGRRKSERLEPKFQLEVESRLGAL